MRQLAILVLSAVAAGCGTPDGRERILLVTTTSVEASGLLDALTAGYHAAQDRYRLSTTAVGSGAALEMGRRGDGDVLLTHHPAGEARFAADGRAEAQGVVMVNEFVLVGPEADPAGIQGGGDVTAAMRAIATAAVRFLSRGDDSGTHMRERALWREAGLEPWRDRPPWYIEAGTGMAETLQMAAELRAYALTDRATYLFLRHRVALVSLLRDPEALENRYSYTIPVAAPNARGAHDFVRWLLGEGQAVIAAHGVEQFGDPLFLPAAGPGPGPAVTEPARPGPDRATSPPD